MFFPPHDRQARELPLYTLLAAVSVSCALDKIVAGSIDIKWVNDLFYQGKKICGILSEALTHLENQATPSLVIGIGLNLLGNFERTDHGEDLSKVAGTLFPDALPKDLNLNQVLVDFLHFFKSYDSDFDQRDFIEDYRQRILGLGQEIYYFNSQGQKIYAINEGINEWGQLQVKDAKGVTYSLNAGEIHLSSQQFYKGDAYA